MRSEAIMPEWEHAVLRAAEHIGHANVFVSIVESGSKVRAALRQLAGRMRSR